MKKFLNKKNSLVGLSILSVIIALSSCEKVIDYKVKDANKDIVIDAFITNDTGTQKIILSYTKNILDSTNPAPILGATVKVINKIVVPNVIDTSRTFIFTDTDNDGTYTWQPNPSEIYPFGIPFTEYNLSVTINNEEFIATTFMDETVDITGALGDSLRPEETQVGTKFRKGSVLTLNSGVRDIAGRPNCYWFKTFRNGVLLNKPANINLSYDAAFGPGFDGIPFIVPIVSALTPDTTRFNKGEVVTVECHSVGILTWYYLSQIRTEIGNTGIFASPPSNISSNIEPKNKDSKRKVLGWFSAAAVSKSTIVIR